jgi:hypothetical protein
MTLTFRIDGIEEEQGHDLPCPDCGLTLANAHLHHDRDFDCSCMGYGGPQELPTPRYELNVANMNGWDILVSLGFEADHCGTLDPRDLLTALTLRGRNLNERYVTVLERIARQAVRYDRTVVWG